LPSLWAEDASVFLAGSDGGFESLFSPYVGYLHLYPRLVSAISTFFPLELVGYVFFAGWFVAISALGVFSYKALVHLGLGRAISSLIFPLLSTVPSNESFFNLANSQFILGALLFVVFSPALEYLKRSEKNLRLPLLALVLVLGLSGPHSIFVSLIRLAYLVASKNFRRFGILDATLIGTALVQFSIIAASGRGPNSDSDGLVILSWIGYLASLFSSTSQLVTAIALVLLILALLFALTRRNFVWQSKRVESTLYFAVGGLLMAVISVTFAVGENHNLVAGYNLGLSSIRYNFGPSFLLMLAGLVLASMARKSWYLWLLVCALALSWIPRAGVSNLQADYLESFIHVSQFGEVTFEANPFGPRDSWSVGLGSGDLREYLRPAVESIGDRRNGKVQSFLITCPSRTSQVLVRLLSSEPLEGRITFRATSSAEAFYSREIGGEGISTWDLALPSSVSGDKFVVEIKSSSEIRGAIVLQGCFT
jgi:hypothetical protein